MFILTSRLNLFNLTTKNLYISSDMLLGLFVKIRNNDSSDTWIRWFCNLVTNFILETSLSMNETENENIIDYSKKTCIEYVNLELLYLESYHSRTLMVYTASFHFVKLHNLLECLFLVVSHQFHVGTTSFALTWQAETPAIPISTLLDLYLWVDVTLLDSCSQFNLSIPLLQLI